jgi:hypothetical protein
MLPVTESHQGVFQDPLDRPFPRIDLEPGEVRAVVFALARKRLGDALSGIDC